MATPTNGREATEQREGQQDGAPVGNFFEFYRDRLEQWGVSPAIEADLWKLDSRALRLSKEELLLLAARLFPDNLVPDAHHSQARQRGSIRLIEERIAGLVIRLKSAEPGSRQERLAESRLSYAVASLMAVLSPAPDRKGHYSPLSAWARSVYLSRKEDGQGSTSTVVEPFNMVVDWLTENAHTILPIMLGFLKNQEKERVGGQTWQVDAGIYITGWHCLFSIINRVLAQSKQTGELPAVEKFLTRIDEAFTVALSYPENVQASLLLGLAQMLSPQVVLPDLVALGPKAKKSYVYEADRPKPDLMQDWQPCKRMFLFDNDSSKLALAVNAVFDFLDLSHSTSGSKENPVYGPTSAHKPGHLQRRISKADKDGTPQTGLIEFINGLKDANERTKWKEFYAKIISFVKDVIMKTKSPELRNLASCLIASCSMRLAELSQAHEASDDGADDLQLRTVGTLAPVFPNLVFAGSAGQDALMIYLETGGKALGGKHLRILLANLLQATTQHGDLAKILFGGDQNQDSRDLQKRASRQLLGIVSMLLDQDPTAPMHTMGLDGKSAWRVDLPVTETSSVVLDFVTGLWQSAHGSGNNFMACLALEAFSRNGKLPNLNELGTAATAEMIEASLDAMPFPLIAKIAEILRVYFPDRRQAWLDKNLKPILERYLAGLPQVQVAKTLRTSSAAQAVISASGQPSLTLSESAVSLQRSDWNPNQLGVISGLVHELQTILSSSSPDGVVSAQEQLSGLLANLRGCLGTDGGDASHNSGLSSLFDTVVEAVKNLTPSAALAVVGTRAIDVVTELVTNLTAPAKLTALLAIVDGSPTFQPFRDQLQLAGLKANAQLLLAKRLLVLLVQDLDGQLSLIGDQRKLALAPARITTNDQLADAQLQATLHAQLATGRADDTEKYRAAVEAVQLAKTHITRAVYHLFQVDISHWPLPDVLSQ